MKEFTPYKLIDPPGDIVKKEARTWTKKEAQAVFNWYTGTMEERIQYFLDYTRMSLTGNNVVDLKVIETILFDQIHNNPHLTDDVPNIDQITREKLSDKTLSVEGISMGHDVARLFAKMIISVRSDVALVIGNGKRDSGCKNLPTIHGPNNDYSISRPVDKMHRILIDKKPPRLAELFFTMLRCL